MQQLAGDREGASFNEPEVEELDEVPLNVSQPGWTVRIGNDLPPDLRGRLVECLCSHVDCFAWSHEDMIGISEDIVTHKLNVDLSHPPVRQKRRKIGFNRN